MSKTILILNYISSFLCISAIALNSLGVYLLSATRPLSNNKCLLINLASSEIIFSAFQMTYNFIRTFAGFEKNSIIWNIGTTALIFNRFSMYFLTVDRLIAISFPLKHRVLMTRKRVVRIILTMGILAVILGVSMMLSTTLFVVFKGFIWFPTGIVYLILCLVTYGLVFYKMKPRRRFENGLQQANIVNRRQQAINGNKKFFKVVALIMLNFIFLVLIPDLVLHLYPAHNQLVYESLYLVWPTSLILDPVIYIFLQDDLRTILKSKFCRWSNAVEAPIHQETPL